MSEVNESNVAIKLKHTEEIIFQMDEDEERNPEYQINPNVTPIITENVPFTNRHKSISNWLIGSNLALNLCFIALIIVLALTDSQLGRAFIIAFTVSAYLVYLVMIYHFSSLLPFVNLQSIHQYKNIYQKLTQAKCFLKFKYVSSRNNIDQSAKIKEEQYKNIKVIDRSGVLYSLDKNYDIIFMQYHKKFYYCDNNFKGKVYAQFNQFTEKCRKQHDSQLKKSLLRSREKIELIIEGMDNEIGFCVSQDHCYRLTFFVIFLMGFGIYYELFMKSRVLRYDMDIVKEVCPNEK